MLVFRKVEHHCVDTVLLRSKVSWLFSSRNSNTLGPRSAVRNHCDKQSVEIGSGYRDDSKRWTLGD